MDRDRGGQAMAERREAQSDGVEQVRGRIEHWRRTRRKRTAMPEELWDEVVPLARVQGVSRIARALGVSYESLKKRVQGFRTRGKGSEQGLDGFVELSMAELACSPGSAGAEVELSGADGAKMIVRLRAGEGVDVLGLAEAFWGRGR